MQSLIDTSISVYGAGNSAMRRQFKIRSGPYSGRKVVIYQATANAISFSFADPPYNSWSVPQLITDQAADYPSCGWMDSDGNIYFVYTTPTTYALAFRKLTFNLGTWSIGAEVIVHNDKQNYFPTIFKDSLSRIHICWTRFDSGSGTYEIRHKRSTSDGATWGAGTTDPGNVLIDQAASCFSQTVYLAPFAYCLYTANANTLACRRLPDGASAWDSEIRLYTGILMGDRLSAAVSESGGIIGVAFESSYKLFYMESNGQNWGGAHELCADPATAPLLLFNGANPYVIYGSEIGTGQIEMRCRWKNGVGFAEEAVLAAESAAFATVYLYDNDGLPKYQNRTAEAADSTPGDVVNIAAGVTLSSVNDALYFGAESPFATINIRLSVAGNGGVVEWSYFNGSEWTAFVPYTGAYHFTTLSQLLRLWIDTAHAPTDWQCNRIEGRSYFWIRARVTTSFTTPPVGSQFTPCEQINYFNN